MEFHSSFADRRNDRFFFCTWVSNRTYIYIRGEYAWIVDILEQAIAEAKHNGLAW